MALLSSIAYCMAIFYAQPVHASKAASIQALAWDYVKLNSAGDIDAVNFKTLTGLDAYSNFAGIPAQTADAAMLITRAVHYGYDNMCGNVDCSSSCTISRSAAGDAGGATGCLNTQSVAKDPKSRIMNESWVVVP